jgi:hypothetical protein
MKLKINGLEEVFNADGVMLDTASDVLAIESDNLVAFINALRESVAVEADEVVEVATEVEITYEPTDKMVRPVEEYKELGWTTEMLVDGGYLTAVEVEKVVEEVAIPAPPVEEVAIPAPPVATVPAAPSTKSVDINGVKYNLTALAKSNTIEDFYNIGWSNEELIKSGYLEIDETSAAASAETTAWPRKNESGEYVDSAGTVFNADLHSMSRDGVPPVTKAGKFKKSRAKKKEVSVPAPPPAAVEAVPAPPPAAPEAPGLDIPAPPPAAPAAEDPELAQILSNWETPQV